MKLLDIKDLQKFLEAPGDPEYTRKMDEIPEPPRFFDAQSAEYFYHLCALLLEKGTLSKWSAGIVQCFVRKIIEINETGGLTPLDRQILNSYAAAMGVSQSEIKQATHEFAE